MIEIKPNDLQVGQTYYIDMSMSQIFTLPEFKYLHKNKSKSKIKAIFCGIIPASYDNIEHAKFYKYTGINSSQVDYNYGSCAFGCYRNYKYYLPTRDALLEKRERETVNAVLQHITGDQSFKYI